ncbi:hypothetical protein B0J13DRAFT_545013 [Dactylonectria estremocensis]|uniref:Uncharacterized protein n=1 Tax=Dactylonectria estremocensis TaxID=1079267 RepID=A0A9P9JC52_9HYPO|nr:hypothetical protein B0J13DRAFT_545013 [Dactylonectria estremocensis]
MSLSKRRAPGPKVRMEVRAKPLRLPEPPWIRHCYAVSIFDFQKPWTKGSARLPNDDVETTLFIQTGDKPIHGWLYSVHHIPYSRNFALEKKRCADPEDEALFDSETAIGYMYKSDFENRLPSTLECCPLPEIPAPGYAVMNTPSKEPPVQSWVYAGDNLTPVRNSTE